MKCYKSATNSGSAVSVASLITKLMCPKKNIYICLAVLLAMLTSLRSQAQQAGMTPLVQQGPPSKGTVTGPATIAAGTTSGSYSIVSAAATSYFWSVSPGSAGSVSGSGATVTVNWSATYNGTATVNCTTTNSYGSTVGTPLTVTIKRETVTISPTAVTINYNGSPGALTPTITNGSGSYSYQWQSSTNNSFFSAVNGAISASFTPTGLTVTTYYKLTVIDNSTDAVLSSNTATITVYPQLNGGTITPSSLPINLGTSPGQLTCSAATGGNGTYVYQWQQSSNGSTWNNITNATTQNYTPVTLIATTYFQRLVTSNNAPAQSNISTITVSPALVPGSISPTSQTTRYNSAPLTNLVATSPSGGSGSYTYQWQTSVDNATWTSISGPGLLFYNPGALLTTSYYRLAITSNNSTVYTNSALVTVTSTGCSTLNSSQGSAYNYTIANTFRIPGITSVTNAQVAAMSNCQVMQDVSYFDGLGRAIQTVQVKASQLGADIVQPMAYDQYDREISKYLPYTDGTSTSGSFRSGAIAAQSVYYHPSGSVSGTQQSNGIINTDAPYANINYEPSPINRLIEQGAPGDAWQLSTSGISGSGHTVKIAYGTNSNEVIMWVINSAGNGAGYTGNYPPGTLYKTTTTDENGNNSIEYKDLRNDVVCKMAQNGAIFLATYYIYDDYNNLAYFVPPIPSSSIPGQPAYPASFLETDQVFLNYMYGYHYDTRERLIQKKIPGKGWEYMIYNLLDQVVFTQDANEAVQQEVSFTKYDALGRTIMTGIETGHSESMATLQANVTTNLTTGGFPEWETTSSTGTTGYTNTAMPNGTNVKVLSISYYDNYPTALMPSTYSLSGTSIMTRGLTTATKTAVLNTIGNSTPDMLWKVNYYDDLGRPTNEFQQHYLGGSLSTYNYDFFSFAYNFTNQIVSTTRQHYTKNTGNNGSALGVTIANAVIYDQTGREKQTYEQINSATNVLLSDNEYNEIGQLLSKNLHSTNSGSTYLQNINYAYNERGWLKTINNPASVTSTQVFGEQIQYNDGSSAEYNGNISGMLWQTMVPAGLGLTQSQESYAFTYDGINRLTVSNYTTPGALGKFNETLGYDALGNIISLQRTNTTTANQYLNNFTYDYTSRGAGNQLYGITDAGSDAQSGTYTYDGNGNVLTDTRSHIQITNINYNILNLPQNVSRTPGNMTYLYDANGTKLEKVSGGITRDYINGIEYNNGTIEFIATKEGRAVPIGGGSYSYEYYLRDHLGNTRAAVKDDGSIVQVQDYYAFGLEIISNSLSPSPLNQYKYNGKEKQQETGEIDYGARFYDPVIARWVTIDPMAEKGRKETPYGYAFDDPLRFKDPDGMWPDWFDNAVKQTKEVYHKTVATVKEGTKAAKKWTVDNKKALLETAKNFQELGSRTTKTGEGLAIAGLPFDGVGAAPGLLLAGAGGVESLSGDALKLVVDVVTSDKKSATTDVVNDVKNEAIDYASDKIAPGGSKLKDAAKVATDYVADKIKEATDKDVDKKMEAKKKQK